MKPQIYRRRPIEIEAMQYTGDNVEDLLAWGAPVTRAANGDLEIRTLEDGREGGPRVKHVASVGDYIVKGLAGGFYANKPHIFEPTHDLLTVRGETDWAAKAGVGEHVVGGRTVQGVRLTAGNLHDVWEWAESKPYYDNRPGGGGLVVTGLSVYTPTGKVKAEYGDLVYRVGAAFHVHKVEARSMHTVEL